MVGVHCARPFHPLLQAQDVAALTQLVLTRTLPIVVAGDFNLTPWADRLKQFTRMTGLGRFNTFILTWPMRWRNDPVLPVVASDNVFASREFAKIARRRRLAAGFGSSPNHRRHRARLTAKMNLCGGGASVLAELFEGAGDRSERRIGPADRRAPIAEERTRGR